MDFNLRQLQLFCKVVDLKSITKAAIELDITQPAISIQLKKLQENFDTPLTEVIGKQLFITEFGIAFYHQSKEILKQVEEFKYTLESYNGVLSGKLKISTVSTGKYIMPFYLKKFLDLNQKVDLRLDVSNRKQVITDLMNHEIDFALVSVLPNEIYFEEELLMKNPLYLIGPKKSMLNDSNFQRLNDYPLIYREEGSGTRLVMQKHFDHIKFTPKIKMELTSNEAVKQAVIAGLGYSMLSLLSIKNELKQKELEIIPDSKMRVRSQWRLIWLKKKKLTPIAEAFISYIKLNKQQIYDTHFSWVERYDKGN
jgi:DNA-binding transcriptional LysR family regulator